MRILLCWWLAVACAWGAGNYEEAYAKLKTEVPAAEREKHLAAWRAKVPADPDAWVLSANWAFEQARDEGISITTKPAAKDDFEVVDPKTNKPVGSIAFDPSYDTAKVKEATGFLREAIGRWPHRLDLHCGLAHMLETTGAWEEEMAALRGLVAASKEHAGKLRWCHDEPLDDPEAIFTAKKLHSFAMNQFRRETPETDQQFYQLAKFLAESYPTLAFGHNDLAVFHSLSKNWPATQQALEEAVRVAPDDALAWMNLGDNSVLVGNPKRARAAFEKVIALDADPELTSQARAALQKLKPAGKRPRKP